MASPAADPSRRFPRVHGSEAVEVFADEASKPVIGVIRDISETGARIRIATARELPDNILLSSPSAGTRRRATIRWREDTSIGIHFDEPASD